MVNDQKITESSRLRVVFMGTPPFAVLPLEALHRVHTIVGVYTQPDRPVGRGLELQASAIKKKALEFKLKVFQPAKLSSPDEFEQLKALQPDVIVVVGYGQILRKNVLELARLGCVNIHSSLLPRWRGAAPIQWAILSGDRMTGITTMAMAEELDAGDVLMQERIEIQDADTAQLVHDRLSVLGAKLIVSTLDGLAQGKLIGRPQKSSEATYAAKLTKSMEWLNPRDTAVTLDRRVRALSPWPGATLNLGKRLKVKQVKVREDLEGPVGQIFEKSGVIFLGTAQGCLELQVLQWEGKKEVDSRGFLNGLIGQRQLLPLQVELPDHCAQEHHLEGKSGCKKK
jgi:methionyl-tRNA formyltransferase